MGAASSTISASQLSQNELIRDTFSLFEGYNPEATIMPEEVAFARSCWNMITEDTAPRYVLLKETQAESTSCLSWFYDKFYEFSHDMDTDSRALYKNNLRVQINALIAMIKMTLHMFESENILESVKNGMTKLASGHYKRGVRSFQYAIVGNVLIRTFTYCLGDEMKDKLTEVWTKMFSMMLKVLIPAAIQVEAEEDAKDQSKVIPGAIVQSGSTSSLRNAIERQHSSHMQPENGQGTENNLPTIAEVAVIQPVEPDPALIKPAVNALATEENTRSNSVDEVVNVDA